MDQFWDSQDVFELRHGAYILSGTYPPDTHEPKLPSKVKAALDLLEFEIKAGRLEVLHWEYPGTRRVRRADLQRLAEQQDYQPATLFPDQPPMTTRERREWARLVKVLCLAAEMDLREPYRLAKLLRGMANDYKVTWPEDDKAMAKKLGQAGEVE